MVRERVPKTRKERMEIGRMLKRAKIIELIHTTLLAFTGHAYPNEMMLMVGTVAAESGFVTRYQIGGGPARGIFQIEPATSRDNYENYLRFAKQKQRYRKLMQICFDLGSAPFFVPSDENIEHLLTVNDTFSTIHARIKYLRDPHAIPQKLKPIAEYYTRVFNTAEGKGTVEKFLEAWLHYNCYTEIARLFDSLNSGIEEGALPEGV